MIQIALHAHTQSGQICDTAVGGESAAPEIVLFLSPNVDDRLDEALPDIPEGLPLYSSLSSESANIDLQSTPDPPRFWPLGSPVSNVGHDIDMEKSEESSARTVCRQLYIMGSPL